MSFILNNWKSLSIVIFLLAIIIKLGYDYKQANKDLINLQESSEKHLQELKEIYSYELYLKEKTIEEYNQRLAEIEEEYRISLDEVESLRETMRQKTLITSQAIKIYWREI